MPVAFYFDHNVDRAVVHGLRLRGVDVLTAFEDGTHRLPDPAILDRATALGRILFTTDVDFLAEARRRQHQDQKFAGVVFARQSKMGIAQQIEDLELIAKAADSDDLADGVLYLPLR